MDVLTTGNQENILIGRGLGIFGFILVAAFSTVALSQL